MAHKKNRFYISKKNSGLEFNLEFFLQSHFELSNVDKMRIDQWMKQQSVSLLANFNLDFPEFGR